MSVVHAHPEWKRLLIEIDPLLEAGRLFKYDLLSRMMGLDVCSPRGRGQFGRFAKELLVSRQFHMENVRGVGYRVVNACEHGSCATRKLKKAQRQLKTGRQIAENVNFGDLNEEQRKQNADILCRLANLESLAKTTAKDVRKIAAAIETKPQRIPSPMITAESSD